MKKIFYNSVTFLILISIVYLSLTSRSIVTLSVNNIDKIHHCLAYGILAFFFWMSLRSWNIIKFNYILTLLFCAFIGGILEVIQSRYGRMMELSDFAADLVGALLGCSVIFFMDHRAA